MGKHGLWQDLGYFSLGLGLFTVPKTPREEGFEEQPFEVIKMVLAGRMDGCGRGHVT